MCFLMLFLGGCENNPAPPNEGQFSNSLAPSVDLVPPFGLPDSKVTDFDSLREVLLPIILPAPAERKLEAWYGTRGQWVPQIGNSENLQAYIEHIYKEQRRDEDLRSAALTKLAQGRIFYMNAQYPQAVDQFHEALEISTAVGDSSTVGWVYLGLSSSILQLKDPAEAEQYANQALELADEINDENLNTVALLITSSIQIHTERMESAEAALKEVIQRSRELKIAEIEKIALLNLSYYYIVTRDFDQAIDLLTKSPILTQGDVSMVTAIRSLNLYEAYVGKKEDDRAYEYLVEGALQSEVLDFAYGSAFCKKSIAEHHERRGEYDLALKAYKEYHIIDEKQAGTNARRELQSLKVKQGVQEKDWEIEKLTRAEQESSFQYKIRRNIMLASFIGLALAFLFFYMLLKYKTRIDHANQNKTIAETRLQVLQSQINPHFIFNAITGIQNSILKSETIDAYNYLGKFSDILRVMANTATTISIRLDQEIDLINNYLALEKLRFRDGFVYSVQVSPDLVDMNHKVPGMLVQPVVENAIVHGVSNLPYQGEVNVYFEKFEKGVKVTVSDNGRGRNEASIIAEIEADKHLSIATENAQKTLKALHAIGYKAADIKTLDLFDEEGASVGTQVTIYLPFLTLTKIS